MPVRRERVGAELEITQLAPHGRFVRAAGEIYRALGIALAELEAFEVDKP